MTRLLILFFLLTFLSGWAVTAQEATPPAKPDDVIERCVMIAEPTDSWTFDGTIITYRPGDGIHGFRADTPSRYYIAFDNDSEYGRFGALSPDGQWFATYLGRMENTFSLQFNNAYYVTAIRVVSTSPNRETYIVPFHNYRYASFSYFAPVLWLDNSHLAAYSNPDFGKEQSWYLIEPFTETSSKATEEQARQFAELSAATYGITQIVDQLPRFSSVEEGTAEYSPLAFVAESPDTRGSRLFITDRETKQIYDTCIETRYRFVFSPTGDEIAVRSDVENGFIYVLDLIDWTAYRLDLAANNIVAWIADP